MLPISMTDLFRMEKADTFRFLGQELLKYLTVGWIHIVYHEQTAAAFICLSTASRCMILHG